MMDSGVAVGAVAEPHADSKDHKEVQEHSLQYEERIAELHSIIAELNKRIGLLQCTTNREKSEFSELHSRLNHSNQEATEDLDEDQVSCVSIPEKQSVLVTADIDNCSDLNLELQRVLIGLETVVCGRKKSSCSLSVAEVDRHIKQLTTASQHCDLAIKTVEEIEGALGKDFYPSLCEERVRWEMELAGLQEENESLTMMLTSKDEEHNHTKATMSAIREERDRLRCHVRELQTRLQSIQSGGGQFSPCCVIPARRTINLSPGELSTSNSSNDIPVAKVAERVKLSKTQSESLERAKQVSDITNIGVSSSVEEHLAHSLQDCSNIQEIFQTLYSHGSAISDNRLREFEVETERLHSRIEHLKSQNDLLTITLEECKNNAERMSMLMGKYESNATALRLALHYSEQCIEAYEILLALTETEHGLVLGQYKVARVSTVESAIFMHLPGEQGNEESVPHLLKQAHDYRKTAETAAKDLLVRLDGSCGDLFTVTGCNVQPWESLSSNSHTSTTSSTTSSCDTDFSKEDEQRLKDYIQQLKNDRAAIKLTMLELESVHIDTLRYDIKPCVDSHRLDLENAVLMQELMAMKEEIAEMKAQLYLLEKEKKALELKLSSQETKEQAYLVQIEHLKSELEEQHEQRRRSLSSTGSSTKDKSAKDTSVIIVSELRSISYSDPAAELNNALQKEMKLKLRVKDLVAALEKLTKCSEIRHQQSAEFVNDLKQANSNLVAAYEKAKKKQQNKLKKLESQMMAMVERHETQVRMLKQRITLLEEETSHQHTNETSL
ncbi:colorectal mutant cancer protein isoform X2 [Tachysurus vachellii]|uniref:colorectal mutant cancer protein isoform X2 n=1 Tax=Tachysurus vachellii TaxID=175792 RepID=UPI00296AF60B|nr:colorectal mutant cancer protein isoform X2 [Tachysurus vachellii]